MTAQQRAKINQENVNRITHRLEEIHDEMHELDDMISSSSSNIRKLVKVIMRVMMVGIKILLAKAWSQWAGDCAHMVGFAVPREIKSSNRWSWKLKNAWRSPSKSWKRRCGTSSI